MVAFAGQSLTDSTSERGGFDGARGSGLPPLFVHDASGVLNKTFGLDLSSKDVDVHIAHFSGLPHYGTAKSLTAYSMVSEALERGRLKPGGIVVEPTSGNTGLALADILHNMGASLIMVVSRKISSSFEEELTARFGAKTIELDDPTDTQVVHEFVAHNRGSPFVLIVKLPTNYCPTDEPSGAIAYAKRLVKEGNGGFVMLDQYTNEANPSIHRGFTAPSIMRAVENCVKGGRRLYVFLSGGTFGTALGLAQFFVEHAVSAKLIIALPRGEDVFGVVDLDNAKRRKFYKELEALAESSGRPDLFEVVEIDSPMEKISKLWGFNRVLREMNTQVDLTGGYSSMLVLRCALDCIESGKLQSAVCVLLFHDTSKMYPQPKQISPSVFIDESMIVEKQEAERILLEKNGRIVYVDPIPVPMGEDTKAKLKAQLEKVFKTRVESYDIKSIEDVLVLDGSLSLSDIRLRPEFVNYTRQASAKTPIVLVCPHGGTSRLLASKLHSMGVMNVYGLRGGLQSILQED
ncbi:MAG: pyridoxal-phosphate dependent enzyme [Thermoprotei archaeon]